MNTRKSDVAGMSDLSGMSGAYALNALNPDEVAAFEAYLAESEETSTEVTELTDTAVLLGLAVDPVTPPASLKSSIFAQLDATPQLSREAPAGAPIMASEFGGRAEAKARDRWFTRPVTLLTSAAAAIALIVGGGVVASTIGENSYQQAQADQLAAINAADDSQRLSVTADGGGTATLVWSGDLASSALIVDGLEPLPSSSVYEMWYIDDAGTARAAGTFTVKTTGTTWRVLEGDLNDGDIIGVTVEPAGGSTAPTTDPIIAIQSA